MDLLSESELRRSDDQSVQKLYKRVRKRVVEIQCEENAREMMKEWGQGGMQFHDPFQRSFQAELIFNKSSCSECWDHEYGLDGHEIEHTGEFDELGLPCFQASFGYSRDQIFKALDETTIFSNDESLQLEIADFAITNVRVSVYEDHTIYSGNNIEIKIMRDSSKRGNDRRKRKVLTTFPILHMTTAFRAQCLYFSELTYDDLQRFHDGIDNIPAQGMASTNREDLVCTAWPWKWSLEQVFWDRSYHHIYNFSMGLYMSRCVPDLFYHLGHVQDGDFLDMNVKQREIICNKLLQIYAQYEEGTVDQDLVREVADIFVPDREGIFYGLVAKSVHSETADENLEDKQDIQMPFKRKEHFGAAKHTRKKRK